MEKALNAIKKDNWILYFPYSSGPIILMKMMTANKPIIPGINLVIVYLMVSLNM
jgi:hypothetical protein